MIILKNVSKTFNNKAKNKIKALNNIELEFDSKGLYVISGLSGSGKTTLLNVIGGLLPYDTGEITYHGISLDSFDEKRWDNYRRDTIGYVFQDNNLINDMNAYQNLELPLLLSRENPDILVETILNKLGIPDVSQREIYELSAGQKQRLTLARAIIKKPDVILADEPTGNLDDDTAILIMQIMKRISEDRLVILVTHNLKLAKNYADYIIEIDQGSISKHINVNLKNNQDAVRQQESVVPEKIEEISIRNINHGLPLKYIFYLGILFIKSGIKKIIISTLILFVSCLMSLIGLSLFTYNLSDNVSRYLRENDVKRLVLSKEIEYINNFGERTATTISKGEYLEQTIGPLDDVYLIYKNRPVSLYNLNSLEGEIYSVNSNYIYVKNMPSPILGCLPIFENEVLVSDYIYNELFGDEPPQFPINIYTTIGMLYITGIVPTMINNLDATSNELNDYYNKYYNYNIYLYQQPVNNYFISIDSFLNSDTSFINYSAAFEDTSSTLFHAQVLISRLYANNNNLNVGSIISFDNLHSEIYNGRYLDQFNMHDFFPNGLEVVGIFEDIVGDIVLSDEDYSQCLSIYNRYYSYDNIVVIPHNIENFTEKFYEIGLYNEPGAIVVNQFYNYIIELNSFLVPVYILMVFLSIISCFNAIENIMNKRQRDVGILRTLGVSKKAIKITFCFVTLFVSFISITLALVSFQVVLNYINSISNNVLLGDFNLIVPSSILVLIFIITYISINYLIVLFQVSRRLKEQIFYNLYR